MTLYRKLIVVLALVLAAGGCGFAGTAVTTDGTAMMVEDGFDVTDMTLLQSTWWTWAASAPEESNPVSDTTGEYCDDNQQVGVWLLAGSFGETVSRECTVPAGVPVAGPAVNLVSDTRADCDQFMRDAEGVVTLNGTELPLHKANPVPITFDTVAGNPVTGEAGEFEGYGCGLWFSVDQLEPGDHELIIEGSGTGFSLSVTYALTVVAT
ncbi:hypothetical protein [Actinophytocola sp.]|uniref:hypothetical protein n=1 Tax=Actinophytocola sp. TaxID=1872138 RepID=UPI002ED28B23